MVGDRKPARKALTEIDDKLAEDNAVGRILRGTAKLIEFPGKTRHVEEKLGPIEQPGTLDGEVIQIGGSTAVPTATGGLVTGVQDTIPPDNPCMVSVIPKVCGIGHECPRHKRTGKLKRDLPHALACRCRI